MSFDGHAFGRRVAAAREWAGLAPKQLAERLGVSTEAIYRLERGQRLTLPSRGDLKLMAEILGQPETWLVSGDSPPWEVLQRASDGGTTTLEELHAQLGAELVRLGRLHELLGERLTAEGPTRVRRKR